MHVSRKELGKIESPIDKMIANNDNARKLYLRKF